MIEVFSVNTLRSAGTLETAVSQAGPSVSSVGEVRPEPVWKSPNSPV
jgi:hypothetical protein